MTQAGSTLADNQRELTPLQKQVIVQGFQEMKKQEMEAQSKMMGGGSGSGPTSGSVRNGAAAGGGGPNKQVEKESFVNPGATDPLENVDEEE